MYTSTLALKVDQNNHLCFLLKGYISIWGGIFYHSFNDSNGSAMETRTLGSGHYLRVGEMVGANLKIART